MASGRAWRELADILWSRDGSDGSRVARERIDVGRLVCWGEEFGIDISSSSIDIGLDSEDTASTGTFLKTLHDYLERSGSALGYCCILLGSYCGVRCSRTTSQFIAQNPTFESLSFAIMLAELGAEEGVFLVSRALKAASDISREHGWSNGERLEVLERVYDFLLRRQCEEHEGLQGLLGIVLATMEVS
jgi:hypothetical protein